MQGKSLFSKMCSGKDINNHKPVVVAEFNDSLGSPRIVRDTHATMTFDGKFKTIIYHGLGFGEIYDLENDPGEINDLWDKGLDANLKVKLMHSHIDAVMNTSSAGIQRKGRF